MQCSNCHSTVEPGAKFCSQCGTTVAPSKRSCPSCQTEVASEAVFCASCGTRLAAADPSQAAAAKQPATGVADQAQRALGSVQGVLADKIGADTLGQAQKKLGDAKTALVGKLGGLMAPKPAPTAAPSPQPVADNRMSWPSYIPLPPALLQRVPEGYTVHGFTGTIEHVRTDNYNGQRNFILHPLPGEEHLVMNHVNSRMGVTDLQIDEVNGHAVWLFAFIGPGGAIGSFLCRSRVTGTWITLHNQQVMHYLFGGKPLGAGTTLKALGIMAVTGSPKLVNMSVAADKKRNIGLNDEQAHGLILDIRGYLDTILQEQSAQGHRL